MANSINWGGIYCDMKTNGAWGSDFDWSANFVAVFSAPTCWTSVTPLSADTTEYKADTTQYKADATQI